MNGLTKKLKRKLKSTWKPIKNDNMTAQNLWDTEKAVKRKAYSDPGLPKEGRKVSDTQPNIMP